MHRTSALVNENVAHALMCPGSFCDLLRYRCGLFYKDKVIHQYKFGCYSGVLGVFWDVSCYDLPALRCRLTVENWTKRADFYELMF